MNYLLKYSASALSQTNRAITQDIARGIPAKNVRKHRAKNSKKQGYRCRIVEPIRAAAELFISCGTLSSAAALGQEAIMPFMLKTKNIGIITPRTPPVLKNANANSTLAASAATRVETTSRRFSAWCFTSFLFAKLSANAHDVYAE